ncbi:MAG: hypothetical protein H0U67_05765 [Gemmatimonadetes bacterium]|nr:hypothetical protein [Gemmatimonadota bacterium]
MLRRWILGCLLAGLAAGPVSGAAAQEAKKVSDPWEQARFEITQQLKSQLDALRARGDEVVGEEGGAAIKRAEADYEERVIRPMIAAARTCNDWKKVLGEMIELERQRQLISGSEDVAWGPIDEAFATGTEVCYEEFYRKCVTEHDLGQISRMVALEADLQLIGRRGEDDPMDPRLFKCATFELEFESRLAFDGFLQTEDVSELNIPVHTRARVRFDLFGREGEGDLGVDGDMNVTIDDAQDKPRGTTFTCQSTISNMSSTPFRVVRFDGDLGIPPGYATSDATTKGSDVAEIVLTVDPGTLSGSLNTSCRSRDRYGEIDDMGTNTIPLERIWPNFITGAHWEDVVDGAIEFRFSKARGEIPAGALFARRSFTRAVPYLDGEIVIDENTVLTLWHRPGGS